MTLTQAKKQIINQIDPTNPEFQIFLTSSDFETREYARQKLIEASNRREDSALAHQRNMRMLHRFFPETREKFPQNPLKFAKSAQVFSFMENGVVGSYASLVTQDCQKEQIPPSSIRKSAYAYIRNVGKIFLHHTKAIPAGTILTQYTTKDGRTLKTEVDEIGFYVVSRPYPRYWRMIEAGELKGYSIAGNQAESEKLIDDISYVPNPCNKQCTFRREN